MSQLTTNEAARLHELEKEIEHGKDTFIRVGNALSEIKESRLYRKDYPNFEVYTERRFGIRHSQAARLITEAAVVTELRQTSPMGEEVTTERAARAITAVPPKKRLSVLQRAISNGAVTGKGIAKAAKGQATIELDATGWPIPSTLAPLWNRGDEVDAILHYLSKLKSSIGAYQQADDALWREVNFGALMGDLDKAWTAIQCAKPYAVCTQCQGHPEVTDGKCAMCKGRGLISRFRYDRLVPDEIKQIRKKGAKR